MARGKWDLSQRRTWVAGCADAPQADEGAGVVFGRDSLNVRRTRKYPGRFRTLGVRAEDPCEDPGTAAGRARRSGLPNQNTDGAVGSACCGARRRSRRIKNRGYWNKFCESLGLV